MLNLLGNIIFKFEEHISKLNLERHSGPFSTLKVTVLGQHGLLIRKELLEKFSLLATTDFDGLLNGEPPLEDIFKRILREEGLSYDEDSEYIWLPEETEYEQLYESKFIEVISPLPIYLIVSKAVKAPEKNRLLVAQALKEYQDSLLALLEKYKVNLKYFLDEEQ